MRTIAEATVTLENDPKFGGTRDETVKVEEYPDGMIGITVEHYDGFHAVYLPVDVWREFRADIIAKGGDL